MSTVFFPFSNGVFPLQIIHSDRGSARHLTIEIFAKFLLWHCVSKKDRMAGVAGLEFSVFQRKIEWHREYFVLKNRLGIMGGLKLCSI